MIACSVVDRNAVGTATAAYFRRAFFLRPLVERHMILVGYQHSIRQIVRLPYIEPHRRYSPCRNGDRVTRGCVHIWIRLSHRSGQKSDDALRIVSCEAQKED